VNALRQLHATPAFERPKRRPGPGPAPTAPAAPARGSCRASPVTPQQVAVDGRQRQALGGMGVTLGVVQDLLVCRPGRAAAGRASPRRRFRVVATIPWTARREASRAGAGSVPGDDCGITSSPARCGPRQVDDVQPTAALPLRPPGVPAFRGPVRRWSRGPRGWVACGHSQRAGLQPCERALGLGAGVGGEPGASSTAEHLRADVRDERRWTPYEHVGDHPRLDIVPGRPRLRRSARPGSPRSGPRPPVRVPGAHGRAGAEQAVPPCDDLRDRLGGEPVQSGPNTCGVTKAWLCRCMGWNILKWIARGRRWPGLPMRW